MPKSKNSHGVSSKNNPRRTPKTKKRLEIKAARAAEQNKTRGKSAK